MDFVGRLALCAIAMLLSLAVSQPGSAQSPEQSVQSVGSARLDNVPPVSPADLEAARAFETMRGASLLDWFADGSLLIQTRFGEAVQLHRVAMAGGDRRQLTFATNPAVIGYRLSGNRFAYIRDSAGDEWYEVLVSNGNAPPVRISEADTRNLLTAVSPDGRFASWSSVKRGSGEFAIVVADTLHPASRRTVHTLDGSAFPAAFSPDGKQLIISRQLGPTERSMLLVDLVSSQVRPLLAEPGAMLRDPQFLPDGRSILFLSNASADAARLVQMDIATGKQRRLSPEMVWDVELFDLSPDGKTAAYSVNEEGYSKVYLRDLASGRIRPVSTPGQGVVSALRFSPDGRRLAVGMATSSSLGDVWVMSVKNGRSERWTYSETGLVDVARLSHPKLIRFDSFDGLSIPAFISRPPAAPQGGRYPVLIDLHGGPEDQARPTYRGDLQYYAARLNVAIIQPNVRGSSGYGARFMSLDNGRNREDAVRDVGALLGWIATQPDLDPKRVVVTGGSYGGYLTLASLVHYSDRLAGGAAAYGISNFITFLESTAEYRRALRRPEYGDERDPDLRKFLEQISPLTNVSRIGKPLMVLQGANDPRVPQREADQMVAALRAGGVPVSYLLFTDEGHGFRREPNQALRMAAQAAFMQNLFQQKQ